MDKTFGVVYYDLYKKQPSIGQKSKRKKQV
jgi:hypothetical protein